MVGTIQWHRSKLVDIGNSCVNVVQRRKLAADLAWNLLSSIIMNQLVT